jgi:hypothetical protein
MGGGVVLVDEPSSCDGAEDVRDQDQTYERSEDPDQSWNQNAQRDADGVFDFYLHANYA